MDSFINRFNKPDKPKKEVKPKVIKPAKEFKNGRLCLNLDSKIGMAELDRRTLVAWEQQNHICLGCNKDLKKSDIFCHRIIPVGRGGLNRDDRQENIQATHPQCHVDLLLGKQHSNLPDDILFA